MWLTGEDAVGVAHVGWCFGQQAAPLACGHIAEGQEDGLGEQERRGLRSFGDPGTGDGAELENALVLFGPVLCFSWGNLLQADLVILCYTLIFA